MFNGTRDSMKVLLLISFAVGYLLYMAGLGGAPYIKNYPVFAGVAAGIGMFIGGSTYNLLTFMHRTRGRGNNPYVVAFDNAVMKVPPQLAFGASTLLFMSGAFVGDIYAGLMATGLAASGVIRTRNPIPPVFVGAATFLGTINFPIMAVILIISGFLFQQTHLLSMMLRQRNEPAEDETNDHNSKPLE